MVFDLQSIYIQVNKNSCIIVYSFMVATSIGQEMSIGVSLKPSTLTRDGSNAKKRAKVERQR